MELLSFVSVDVTDHVVAHNWITEHVEPTYIDNVEGMWESLFSVGCLDTVEDLFVPREVVDLITAVEATSEDTVYFRFIKF